MKDKIKTLLKRGLPTLGINNPCIFCGENIKGMIADIAICAKCMEAWKRLILKERKNEN